MGMPTPRNYRNEYLFSEVYLQDITQRPVSDENLRASFQTIEEWREFADKTSLERWTTTYVEPALDTLGFGHQKDSEEQANILILFPDVDKTQATSLCYIVPPGDDINCTLKGKHWAEKIIRGLRKYNFQWGILTDGVYWRIYHTKEPTPYETYIEVNLETILSSQDYAAFQIFYFFFRPDNFAREENGECKFDIYKKESVKTTEYIEENLRAAIERTKVGGEGVLQTLCLGYLNTLNKDTYNEEERVRIYRGATLYLFRLLFLFYSTARGLLKTESTEAFKSIVQDSSRLHNEGGAQSNSYDLWFRVQDLFAEIDLTYDGGLFNPYESNLTQFIEETRSTDPFLSEVVFGLAYYQKSEEVEYRDLSVRHLGSLYEGLLEHNLFIAEENKVIRKSGNKIRFIPESKAGKITRYDTILPKGKIYFSEDAKERKLTGSYYTPEDVVEYIVKNTVDTLLAEKKKELINEIDPILNDLESAINESERRRLELFIDENILRFIEEEILTLSVLDPTMGSGHFLVNATNHIANYIVEILNEYPGYDSKIDSNPGLWRRKVVEDCMYGVDLNPLAVELAKLCLWITTAFKEKPLSFLNHHLKQGNALVGVRISDLEKYLRETKSQYSLFMQSYLNCIKEAAKSYKEKLSKLTEAREDIEGKKEILTELDEELAPYKQLCNLFTHYLLGEVNESDLLFQVETWSESGKSQKVSASLNSKNFFHWNLEFPDVFAGDNSGFDCVIGNPPYVKKTEVRYKIDNTPCSELQNIYAPILAGAIDRLTDRGWVGFVVPNSSSCSPAYLSLRRAFKDNLSYLKIANFSIRPQPIFKGVMQRVSIITGNKGKSKNTFVFTTRYIRPTADTRPRLLEMIEYAESSNFAWLYEDFIPKLGNSLDLSIFGKLMLMPNRISHFTSIGNDDFKSLYFHDSGESYWTKALNFVPKGERNGKQIIASKWKEIRVHTDISPVILCILNSGLFYWFWLATSDCRDLTLNTVKIFPTPEKKIILLHKEKFDSTADKLMDTYKQHTKMVEKRKGYKSPEIKVNQCKHIIDLIDDQIAIIYGLSDKELDYIKNFDSNVRIVLTHENF